MARRRRKKKRILSLRVKRGRKKFAQAVDTCIVVASKSRAGTRMRALGLCVKRILR